MIKNIQVKRERSGLDRLAVRLGNINHNMNVRDEYSEDRSINSKMTTLLGPYKYSNRFKTPEHKRRSFFDQEKSFDRFLDDGKEKPINFVSDLQKLVKRRVNVINSTTTTKTESLLKDFKERSLALKDNEPILDCFIKMKREGHFNRENPVQVTNYPTYTLETRDLPVHKVSKAGYMRNRYGKPMMW